MDKRDAVELAELVAEHLTKDNPGEVWQVDESMTRVIDPYTGSRVRPLELLADILFDIRLEHKQDS